MSNEESGPTDTPEETTTRDEDTLSETGKEVKNIYFFQFLFLFDLIHNVNTK